MKKYEIIFGGGYAESKIVEVEDWHCEQDAVDVLIDQLEDEGKEWYFLKWEDTKEEGGEHYEDEYVIGGNHSRILYHGGQFRIEEVTDEKQAN